MSKFDLKNTFKDRRGITLLIAVLTSGLLLSISLSIFNIALKELIISSSGRDSHIAFYAADSGIECALYWQYRGAFSTSTPSTIRCAGASHVVGGSSSNSFTISDPASGACAHVAFSRADGKVQIEARGYNTCQNSTRRTERAIRVKY
jgi:hypothetical protein